MGSIIDNAPVLTATSDYPELCIEWLPNLGPGWSDGEWCDITTYFTQGNTARGRQYELDQFETGTCQLTLVANTRLFDPENTASPFYPYLIPMRQIRVSTTWNSTRYPGFQGFITDWGQTTPSDKMFETTIRAVDGFGRLEQRKLPSSAWALEVEKDAPSLWFRLGETDTARVTDSTGGNYGIFDNVTQGADGLVPNDADGAVEVGHSTDERVTIQNPSLISGYPFTIEAMIQTDATNPGYAKTIFAGLKKPSSLATDAIVLEVQQDTQLLRLKVESSSGGGRYVTSSSVLSDGLPHHVAVVCSSASSFALYVDGTDETTVTASGNPTWWTTAQNGYTIGNLEDTGLGDFGFDGTIDEVVVFDGKALSAARIAAHALAALNGWEGDDTGARVTRFLDAIDWPATLRDIDTGISELSAARWSAGDTALDVLQGWADTEFGQFFMGKDGKLVWRSRHFPYLDSTSTSAQATFGDAHSAATLKFDNDALDLVRDETLIRNPVQASREDGVTLTVRDAVYVEKYGDRTWAAPASQEDKDSAVKDRATWLLARYKELGSRLERMSITPRRDASNLWPQVLGREIGERVTIKRTPLGLNSEIVVDQIIERVEHEFTPRSWVTTFAGSPTDPSVGDFLILDDSTYGKLNTGVLAY